MKRITYHKLIRDRMISPVLQMTKMIKETETPGTRRQI